VVSIGVAYVFAKERPQEPASAPTGDGA